MFDTIAAISSGIINQPISIIRISGPDALTIAQSFFSTEIKEPGKMTLGFIWNQNQKIDEILLTYFKTPNSFTGEDMVEIYAHGGVINTQRILQLILSRGARQANRGEFSLRAVLNQKIDLVKAEAIHDLIFAKTETQADLSIKKFDGKTQQMIENLKNQLLSLIATCEVNIDYPEYDDIEVLTNQNLQPKIKQMLKQINQIVITSKRFKHIFEGINVVLIGQPNSGKSSLLNALLNENKAIVSSQSGTTRDVVEGQIRIDGVLLNLKDTAGIHSTNDEIEQQGINKSLQEIKKAHLILHIVDGLNPSNDIISLIKPHLVNQKYLKVINKKDLLKLIDFNSKEIYISALNSDIDALLDKIKELFPMIEIEAEGYLLNTTRQLALMDESKLALERAKQSLENFHTPDTVIVDLQAAWTALGNILGHVNNETLLDEMFKNFCLGK